MNPLTDAAAVQAFPELAGLIALRNRGWTFRHLRNAAGDVLRISGFCRWPGGWSDGLVVLGATDAVGFRILVGNPPGLVWERPGTLADVVVGLLHLPPPHDPRAPCLIISTAPPTLWT